MSESTFKHSMPALKKVTAAASRERGEEHPFAKHCVLHRFNVSAPPVFQRSGLLSV